MDDFEYRNSLIDDVTSAINKLIDKMNQDAIYISELKEDNVSLKQSNKKLREEISSKFSVSVLHKNINESQKEIKHLKEQLDFAKEKITSLEHHIEIERKIELQRMADANNYVSSGWQDLVNGEKIGQLQDIIKQKDKKISEMKMANAEYVKLFFGTFKKYFEDRLINPDDCDFDFDDYRQMLILLLDVLNKKDIRLNSLMNDDDTIVFFKTALGKYFGSDWISACNCNSSEAQGMVGKISGEKT